jgi:hypothetical protein
MIKVIISGKTASHVANHIAELHKLYGNGAPVVHPIAPKQDLPEDVTEDKAYVIAAIAELKMPQGVVESVPPQKKRGRPPSAATTSRKNEVAKAMAAELAAKEAAAQKPSGPKHDDMATEEAPAPVAVSKVEESVEEVEDNTPSITDDMIRAELQNMSKAMTAKVAFVKAKALLEQFKSESISGIDPLHRHDFVTQVRAATETFLKTGKA